YRDINPKWIEAYTERSKAMAGDSSFEWDFPISDSTLKSLSQAPNQANNSGTLNQLPACVQRPAYNLLAMALRLQPDSVRQRVSVPIEVEKKTDSTTETQDASAHISLEEH